MSISTPIPELRAMTISFWMRTQQESEGTILSYATKSQADELVITTHPRLRVILKGGTEGSDANLYLNDGNWHFLWITWESSTGNLHITKGATTYMYDDLFKTALEGGGYLVLGQRQQSQKEFIEAKAFVGEIAHVNIWDEIREDLNVIRADYVGLHVGNIFSLPVDRIETRHSASIIAPGMCTSALLE